MNVANDCSVAVSELAQVAARIDPNEYDALIDALIGAERIFTLGGGRVGLMVRAFTMRLTHLRRRAFWIWDDTTPSIGPGDVLLVASGPCAGGVIEHIVKRAKSHGAGILVVTADSSGPVGAYADVTAHIPAAAYLAKGDLVPTQQMMGSLFEQMLLIVLDCVALEMRRRLGLTVEETEAMHRNVE